MGIKTANEWFNRYKVHLISWTLFIIWESVVIGLSSGIFGHPVTYITHYTLIILLFYTHSIFTWPIALAKPKHAVWKAPLLTALEIGTFIILSYLLDKLLIKLDFLKNHGPLALTVPYTMRTLYRGLYFLGFSTGFYYLRTFIQEKKRSLELEKQNFQEILIRRVVEEERTQAQNAFLMAQINPHFFFNTLDYLYHNVSENSPQLAEAIAALGSMMRFAIDANQAGNYIIIDDEIEQLENLLYLHQIRKPLFIDLNVSDEVRDISIIPLVLLTLAENLFKHGILDDAEQKAEISIYTDNTSLIIETRNAIKKMIPSGRSGTGLKNIQKRLHNAYGEKVILTHQVDENDFFYVRLDLPLSLLTNAWTFSSLSEETDKE